MATTIQYNPVALTIEQTDGVTYDLLAVNVVTSVVTSTLIRDLLGA